MTDVNDRRLMGYCDKPVRVVVGLHSGTSSDGCTAMVARVDGSGDSARIAPLHWKTYDYPSQLREAIVKLGDRRTAYIDQLAQADIAVGRFFAHSARQIMSEANMRKETIDLVASSGQVCYQVAEGQVEEHKWLGGTEIRSMVDLGDGAVIAHELGLPVISALRRSDNAVGGFGVPLVPWGDWAMFRSAQEGRVIWNIGGIANPTILPRAADIAAVWAFDSGPGNMLIDGAVRHFTKGDLAADWDGKMAQGGTVSAVLLEAIIDSDEFLHKAPPKVAARQVYGDSFLQHVLALAERLNVKHQYDIVATLTAVTANGIAKALREVILPVEQIDRIIVGGGGVRNPVLMARIREQLGDFAVDTTEEYGTPVDGREVMAVILTANQTAHGLPGNVPRATGAYAPAVMGAIHFPPPIPAFASTID